MAGREKISAKKMQNMGLGKLQHACGEIVHQYMSEKHPLSLSNDDEKAMHELASLSMPEWSDNMMGYQRLLVTKLILASISSIPEMKPASVHTSLKYATDSLREMQGDASQHVEKTRRGLTPEEMEDLLKDLPKKADIIKDE